MRLPAALALLTAVAFATLGARAAPQHSPTPVQVAPSIVLANYDAALRKLKRPKALSFEYTVTQLGARNIDQSHRVYRGGLNERDETLMINGSILRAPAVRIINNRTYRYDIGAVAPRASAYAFAFADVVHLSNAYVYVFKTHARGKPAFAVSEVDIDGRTFLPAVLRFRIAGRRALGSGALQYGPSDVYWVIREADVNARLTNRTLAHERIVWTKYRFYGGLPPATFEAPRPRRTPGLAPLLSPMVTPAPVPAPAVAPLLKGPGN